MANNAKGLGKVAAALLGDNVMESSEEKTSLYLPISQVERRRGQPRKQFDPDALAIWQTPFGARYHPAADGAQSCNPATIRSSPVSAAGAPPGMAGLDQVPAIVIEADDRKAMELAMIENLQRKT